MDEHISVKYDDYKYEITKKLGLLIDKIQIHINLTAALKVYISNIKHPEIVICLSFIIVYTIFLISNRFLCI